ncbi:MAG TPA: polysaccharide deacetylase family protein [Bacteroidota bacterium]|jgi:peptidoglycan/xylan/chitin deacetylase (PgdA/CDA1 family)
MSGRRRFHNGGNPRMIKVLMYHRIVEEKSLSEAYWTCVHVREFQKQLELLDRWGFTPITFNDYSLFLQGELNLPRKPVILTFDDGYRDTYDVALPLLQEFGAKAVVFVLGYQGAATNFWDRSESLPEVALMDRRQIVELHQAGFEIGSHSLNHTKLTALTDYDAWQEISRSRILLEILLNSPVRSFSYPYGSLNPYVKEMVEHAGYDIACGVSTGPANFGEDPYEIRRITILNTTTTSGFALRLLTPFQYYGWARWKAGCVLYGRQHDNGAGPGKDATAETEPPRTLEASCRR